jgi:iron(III) transport system substrate-binding protein
MLRVKSLRSLLVAALVAISLAVAGCGGDAEDRSGEPDPVADPTAGADPEPSGTEAPLTGDLVIYSGRREPLFEPVVAAFEGATGIDVSVKYGGTTELGNALIEEKSNARADVFVGTDAASAEALREQGVFAPFEEPILEQIPAHFRADDGSWVGVSGRARVIMYNTDLVAEADLPDSVFELTDERWKGKIAIPATTNSSFTAWVASLRVLVGDDAARDLLQGLKDNDVTVLQDHTAVRQAVGDGEFALGLVNHYYYELERDGGSAVGVIYPDQGDGEVGVLVNAAAVSLVAGSPHEENARAFMRFLIGAEAQEIFANTNFEYPLVAGIEDTAQVKRGTFRESEVDLVELGQMNESTLDMIDEVGLE